MPLTSGMQLGPYEILSPVGAGGMGEVYKARDTRLDRTVAIKVLPGHLADDPNLRQRFEREARALSSLSHAHICTLYDIGHENGTDFLVMEFLEGESLAQRLEKGPLPPDQLLRYALQIADALDKAHRQGVIHRDLKPSNIVLTKAGAKLVDFGLAKPAANVLASAISDMSKSPTQSIPLGATGPLTAEGSLVGTFQYMAPEQLEGRDADARTDLFAFGCVLYEMATGKPAFAGKSKASLIASILTAEPPALAAVAPLTPPALERVVRICLAKDADDRFQTAHDLKLQLEWVAEGGSLAGVPAPVTARRRLRERAVWAVAALALLAALAASLGLVRYAGQLREASRTVRATMLPPDKTIFGPAVVSPDGRRLAFEGWSEGRSRLWVQSLDSLAPQPLSGTEDANHPFWSADSRFLGFFAGGKLKKIDAAGGPPQTLCDAPQGRGGTWNQEGVIVFAPDTTLQLHRVAAAGGASMPLGKLDESRQETTHRWPWFLPDGRHFLYLGRSASPEKSAIFVGSLDGEPPKLLVNAESSVAYAPPGYLLFLREQTLMAQPFSASRLETTGDAFPVAERVRFNFGNWKAFFSVSTNGVLVYQTGSAAAGGRLHWYDRSGRQVGAVGATSGYRDPSLSPDGRYVSLNISDPQSGNIDVWLYELGRDVQTRFTFDAGIDAGAVWSPDGSRVAFHSNRKGVWNLYLKPASGAGAEEALLESEGGKFVSDWSRDARFLLYEHNDPKTRGNLWVLSMQGERKPYLVLQTPYDEDGARFSPNGRWIAYTSDESGRDEVYVIPFQLDDKGVPVPSPAGKWQVSTGGGWNSRWRRDGKELYYLSDDDKVMAVEIRESGASLEIGAVRPLFQARTLSGPGRRYDVSPDGQRFLINTLEGEEELSPLTLVVNWTTEIRK